MSVDWVQERKGAGAVGRTSVRTGSAETGGSRVGVACGRALDVGWSSWEGLDGVGVEAGAEDGDGTRASSRRRWIEGGTVLYVRYLW